MVFPVVMYGCESWTIKKTEHWIIDSFKLWCWRRLLRVPCIAKRSNQSILKEIKPKSHWSWSSNILATWCEELTRWKRPRCWERLRAGGEEDDRGWDGWMASLIQKRWTWANSRRWWGTEKAGVLQPMESQSWTWLGNWTTTKCACGDFIYCVFFLLSTPSQAWRIIFILPPLLLPLPNAQTQSLNHVTFSPSLLTLFSPASGVGKI